MKIDLSLTNADLYAGCTIEEVAGRLNLKTAVAEAVNTVGRNIHRVLADVPADQRSEVTLWPSGFHPAQRNGVASGLHGRGTGSR